MERVQFQQEQMLAELKDLVDKSLFTVKETKLIMKKRTEFERALVRRVAKKADFLRYAAYEMSLEQLRKKRKERLQIPRNPVTISDYSLAKRKFQIFERALKKFKGDVALWIEYINEAKREGARTLVGRITARAVQLHPNVPAFYILAASHEMDNASPTAARALLQRGIRINEESIEMWREYVRMELGFVENLRRRWEVLGINNSLSKGKEKAVDVNMDVEDSDTTEELPLDDTARQEIMSGAIVKTVISGAVAAIPKFELFEELYRLLQEQPCQSDLRQSLLGQLDILLMDTLPLQPQALRLFARRVLSDDTSGVALVDGLRAVNERLLNSLQESDVEDVSQVYAEFVECWCSKNIDDNLKEYLIKSLEMLIHRRKKSHSLLCAHIKILTRMGGDSVSKAVILSRKYTSRCPHNVPIWTCRVLAEVAANPDGVSSREVLADARKIVESVEELDRALNVAGFV